MAAWQALAKSQGDILPDWALGVGMLYSSAPRRMEA